MPFCFSVKNNSLYKKVLPDPESPSSVELT